MIMVRTLRRDIARYNAGESDSLAGLDETIEETGWKLVHGDVFRPPINSRLFAAVIGSGIQIFFMALITICKIILFTWRQLHTNFMSYIMCFLNMSLHFHSLRDAGDAFAGESRSFGYLCDIFIRVFWLSRWLLFCTIVQDYARPRMEKSRFIGKNNLTRCEKSCNWFLHHFLHYWRDILGWCAED